MHFLVRPDIICGLILLNYIQQIRPENMFGKSNKECYYYYGIVIYSGGLAHLAYSKPFPNQYSILFKQQPPFQYFYFLITFISPFFVYMSSIYISCFICGKMKTDRWKLMFLLKVLARERFYCILIYFWKQLFTSSYIHFHKQGDPGAILPACACVA